MVRTRVTLSGFRELEQALGDLSKAAGSGVLRRAGTKAMQPMADLAARLAPDDATTPPVDLHTSIGVSARARTGRGGLQEMEKGNRVNIHVGPAFDLDRYARALVMEFGSYKDQPQPYMRPAFDQDGAAVIERLKPLLRAEIDKAVARAARRAAARG
jgi:HK97 gp10 family phage protein